MAASLQRRWLETIYRGPIEDSTVVSYNVTGRLEESEQSLFQRELEALQGDIICLQRITSHYYYRMLLPFMTRFGYSCEFVPYKDDNYDAGLATFVKLDRFALIGYSAKDMDSLLDELDNTEEGSRSSVTARTPAVLQITDLLCRSSPNHRRSPNQRLRVLNFELIDVDENSPMSVIQVYAVMKEAMAGGGYAAIICSDLGVVPNSVIYHLLSGGSLHVSYQAQWQHNAVFQRFEHLLRIHGPRFNSVYSMFSTTVSNMRSRIVVQPSSGSVAAYSGYIWLSDNIKVTAVLTAQDEVQTAAHPEFRQGTRHIALAARFK